MSILIGAIAIFIFGFLWYGPLFGKQWMKMMKFTHDDIEKGKQMGFSGMLKPMVINLVFNLVTAWAVTYLIPQLGPTTFGEFFHSMFIIWAGFIIPPHLTTYLWEKKPLNLLFFNLTYSLISLLILSAIIYHW